MKTSLLRMLGMVFLFALLLGALIATAGWFFGWRTTTPFSNAFFVVGAILITIGVLSVAGGFSMRSDFKVLYSQSAGSMDINERNQRWLSDITQGYSSFIFLLLTGLLLIAAAVMLGSIFA
jgi:hypothetical protein